IHETERNNGSQSSNLYSFNRFPASEPPKRKNNQGLAQIENTAPASLNEAVELAKKEMIRKSYKVNKSSRRVAKDLQISQTYAARLIREYCQDLSE
ncbi:hypothetical protein V7111_10905, partial [Neobacillus niacini]